MATTAASHKRAVYSYNWAENVIPSWSGLHDSFNISHTVRISTQSHRNFKNKILLNTEPNTKIIHRWYFLFDNAFVRNHGLFRRLRNPGVNAESFGNILLPHRFFFLFQLEACHIFIPADVSEEAWLILQQRMKQCFLQLDWILTEPSFCVELDLFTEFSVRHRPQPAEELREEKLRVHFQI